MKNAVIGVIIVAILAISTIAGVLIYKFSDPSLPIADDSKATSESVKKVVEANNQFAIKFYDKIKDNKGNLFYSPYSMSMAFGMMYEGAKEKTASEIESVFNFPTDDDTRRGAMARIYDELNNYDEDYKFTVANALWIDENYKLLEDYTKNVEKYYGGVAKNVDFSRDITKSTEIINSWVEDKTNNKIKDLFPQGSLSENTKLVLTNAVYFKGTWKFEFKKENTREGDFTKDDGSVVKTQMMNLNGEEFKYLRDDKLQIIEMPYDGEKLSMMIILPEKIGDFEKSLSSEKINEWNNELKEQKVNVYLPKFIMNTKYSLNEYLKSLGMPLSFTENADFSGIDGTKNLFVQSAIHQAFVDVNEEGTEAAAATGISMGVTSVGPGQGPEVFRADHPFIFIIRDKTNDNILFMGRMSEPGK